MTAERLLRGFGVSPGITIGPARVIHWDLPEVPRRLVGAEEADGEIARFRAALENVRGVLGELRDLTRQKAGPEEAQIFEAQMMMLEDPVLVAEVEMLIRENQLSAEGAFEFKTLEMRALWAQSPSAILRQRVADLVGLQIRVLNHLVGASIDEALHADEARAPVVFIRELTPGLTVQLERERVAGLVAIEGTKTSHAAILARSLGIPCIMGLIEGFDRVQDGMEVILDATHGVVLLDPTTVEVSEAQETARAGQVLRDQLERVRDQPAVTLDGVPVTLRSNVDLPEEVDGAVDQGADGVGLLRTEFLVLGRTELPGEEEQAAFYAGVAERFGGRPVVIRTYDLGGDKFPSGLLTAPEANPFLGWRAIRVCLDQPKMFRTQIRALLRARTRGDVRMLVPMISQVEEVVCTREWVGEEARRLAADGVEAAADLPVGIMIETPAAAIQADDLARRVDFLSVGTNDLTQYTLAVDRGNARLAGRFTPHHPAVIQLLKRVADAGAAAGIETSVCGEMAADPLSAFLLLGLGYRVLSVSPPSLLLVRWLVRHVPVEAAVRAADEALAAAVTADVNTALAEGIRRYVDLDLLQAGRLPGVNGSASFPQP